MPAISTVVNVTTAQCPNRHLLPKGQPVANVPAAVAHASLPLASASSACVSNPTRRREPHAALPPLRKRHASSPPPPPAEAPAADAASSSQSKAARKALRPLGSRRVLRLRDELATERASRRLAEDELLMLQRRKHAFLGKLTARELSQLPSDLGVTCDPRIHMNGQAIPYLVTSGTFEFEDLKRGKRFFKASPENENVIFPSTRSSTPEPA